MKNTGADRPPIPSPPRAYILLPAMGCGVFGTGLLYSAATSGSLTDLIVGVILFGVGLRFAGWPFVLASASLGAQRDRERQAKREGG